MILKDLIRLVSTNECIVICDEDNEVQYSCLHWNNHLFNLQEYLGKEVINYFSSRCPLMAETRVPMRNSAIWFKVRTI